MIPIVRSGKKSLLTWCLGCAAFVQVAATDAQKLGGKTGEEVRSHNEIPVVSYA
jgi:hypothetical protein